MKNIKSIEEFLFESKSSAKKRFLDRGLVSEEIFERFLEVDITPTKKFIEKMCEFFVSGSSEGEIVETFEKAISLSERNILTFDISLIKSLSEIQKLISEKENYQSRSERKSNIEVVYEDSRFKVVKPKTKEEAILYGKDTEWCISALKTNLFNNYYYKQEFTIYIIIDKTKNDRSPYSKIAVLVHKGGYVDSVWDSNDTEDGFVETMKDIGFPHLDVFKYDPNKPEWKLEIDDVVKGRGKWTLNSNNEYDVDGDVSVIDFGHLIKGDKIPFKFGKVTGDFVWSGTQITTLEGCPNLVGETFYCTKNKLTSLEFAPLFVGKNFSCYHNKITNLDHFPVSVGGDIQVSGNQLIDLVGLPKEVKGALFVSDNNLTTLKGCSEIVHSMFDCSDNYLTSLEYAPKEVYTKFWCFMQKNNHQFTEDEVEKNTKVLGKIIV
jgi:hypothetical protein